MSVATSPTTTDLIEDFAQAPPERLGDAFLALVAALWDDGALTGAALPAVPDLAALFARADETRQGHLAILLGLLAEAEYPATDGPVAAAVRRDLDAYLDLLGSVPPRRPLSLALRYLLSHFPGERDRVLAVAGPLGLDADDLSRLDRALARLDPERPSLGRVFPSPAVWRLDEKEQAFDDAWIRTLSPEQVRAAWEDDTRTVYGSTGAKAYWAVRNGEVASLPMPGLPPRDSLPLPAEPERDLFGPHADVLRCPACGGGLEFAPGQARCAGCAARYPLGAGVLDLTAPVPDDAKDFQFKLAEMPSMGLFYEAYARPNFLRVSGTNYGDEVTPEIEDAYIAEHLRPVDGPVLDLAAGAGRWTETLARAVGPERVIALDLNPPMLTALRARLPELPAVLAGAASLPIGDATLGAVLCWNALQAFPDHAAAAVAEAARCLKPGGVLSFLTFRRSPDPLYRHFQSSHRFPQHGSGLRLFDLEEIKGWLDDAGLRVRHEWYPGTFVFITAERPA